MTYGRYMVFSWCEFDNPKPFECLDLSTNDIKIARKALDDALDDDGLDSEDMGACIFDRVKGEVLVQ